MAPQACVRTHACAAGYLHTSTPLSGLTRIFLFFNIPLFNNKTEPNLSHTANTLTRRATHTAHALRVPTLFRGRRYGTGRKRGSSSARCRSCARGSRSKAPTETSGKRACRRTRRVALRQLVRLGLGEAVVGGVEVVVNSVVVGAVLNGNKVVVGGDEVCDACVLHFFIFIFILNLNFSLKCIFAPPPGIARRR